MRRCETVAHPRSLFLTAQWHQCGRIGIRHEFRRRERGAADLPHQRMPAQRPYRVRPAQSACQRRRLSVRVACRSDHAWRQHLDGRQSGTQRSRSAHALDQATPSRFSRRGYRRPRRSRLRLLRHPDRDQLATVPIRPVPIDEANGWTTVRRGRPAGRKSSPARYPRTLPEFGRHPRRCAPSRSRRSYATSNRRPVRATRCAARR